MGHAGRGGGVSCDAVAMQQEFIEDLRKKKKRVGGEEKETGKKTLGVEPRTYEQSLFTFYTHIQNSSNNNKNKLKTPKIT